MSDYDPYHFSFELIDMLVSVIPLLNRSKRGTLTFFRSCGVPDSVPADLTECVSADANSISKYEIARTVLRRINDSGDMAGWLPAMPDSSCSCTFPLAA